MPFFPAGSALARLLYCRHWIYLTPNTEYHAIMAKNTRKLNKANHGKRPASSKARKIKRSKIKT